MEVDSDPKNMSLADIIKKDKSGGRGGKGAQRGGGRPQSARGGRGGGRGGANAERGPQGGRPRFGSNEFKNKKGGRDMLKAKRTGNMISKQNDRPRFDERRGGSSKRPTGERRVINKAEPRKGGFRSRGGAPLPQRGGNKERGGLARVPRKAVVQPKREGGQRTLRIGNGSSDKKQAFVKTKTLRPSDVRLKVRNIDEKQVTNDDLKKLFAKIGELKVCRFDRNEFGQFLGSATVTYDRPEFAKEAINQYHGAFLDDKVLTVEYDMVPQITKVVQPNSGSSTKAPNSARSGAGLQVRKGPAGGKTLRLNKN